MDGVTSETVNERVRRSKTILGVACRVGSLWPMWDDLALQPEKYSGNPPTFSRRSQ